MVADCWVFVAMGRFYLQSNTARNVPSTLTINGMSHYSGPTMYVQRQKTQSNQRYKIRYQTDPQFKMAVVVRKRVILALKARGASKSKSLRELIGCSIQELKQHLESKFREGMSWENHGEWHVDHIRPCADFDLTNPEEQKNCFHFSNLQPLWAEENLRKSNKLIL
jgi:hypothetical protein